MSGEMVERSWRCFHCDETFTDRRCAQLHFGRGEDSDPACVIKAGAEGSILRALRDAEEQADNAIQAMHNESTDAAKAYHNQRTRHHGALIAAEELGYERGLADGRELSAALAPKVDPQGSGAGNVRARARELLAAELRCRPEDVHHELMLSGSAAALRAIEAALQPRPAAMREALKRANIALDDWLHTYASDLCDQADVETSRARIGEYGTLSYIGHVQEQIRAALQRSEARQGKE